MKHNSLRNPLSSVLLLFVLCGSVLLHGCDSISNTGEELEAIQSLSTISDGSTELLIFLEEPDEHGIPSRLIKRYGPSTRIVEEYGIIRRVLNQYEISHEILFENDVDRITINYYTSIFRLIKRYGADIQILGEYNDHITPDLLNRFEITEDILTDEGFLISDIERINSLSSLLNDHGITVQQFLRDIEQSSPAINYVGETEGTPHAITIAIDVAILNDFLKEIEDDPEITIAESAPIKHIYVE